jgi:hypothetical protein
MNIVAYQITGNDNGAHYFREAPESVFCPACDSVNDPTYVPTRLLHVRSRYPFSYTYDNRPIATEAFRNYCLERDPDGLEFVRVNAAPELYVMSAKRIVEFDAQKRRTKFIRPCDVCGRFTEVIGASPGFLRNVDTPLDCRFYRSDLEFGSRRNKHPVLLVGPELRYGLEKHKFKSMYFHPVYGASTTYEELVATLAAKRVAPRHGHYY